MPQHLPLQFWWFFYYPDFILLKVFSLIGLDIFKMEKVYVKKDVAARNKWLKNIQKTYIINVKAETRGN